MILLTKVINKNVKVDGKTFNPSVPIPKKHFPIWVLWAPDLDVESDCEADEGDDCLFDSKRDRIEQVQLLREFKPFGEN